MDNVSIHISNWLAKTLNVEFVLKRHDYSNQDEVYSIQTSDRKLYLKISSSLKKECENLIKLKPYLNVPDVIDFQSIDNKDHLLLSDVRGSNLAELVGKWEDIMIVREFARAAKHFHTLDVSKLYPGKHHADDVVLHGDMSMPNIISVDPGSTGYIDLAQMNVGSVDSDLADAIWSIQRNMGQGYGERFLHEYGDVTITEKIDKALSYRFTT